MEKKESPKTIIQKSILQRVAEKYNTDYSYVSNINTGARKPIRGKGLKIKEELIKINKELCDW